MEQDAEFWKTHARRHERKLRKLQTATNSAIVQLDRISDELEKALGDKDDRD